jgi:hypothetical protein
VARDRFQTRLPDDRAEKVYEFQEDRDVSQAEAVRRLLYAGLEAEADEDEDDGAEADEDEKMAMADGGITKEETKEVVGNANDELASELTGDFQRQLRIQQFTLAAGFVYIAAVASGTLRGIGAIAVGVVVLLALFGGTAYRDFANE